MNHEKSKLLYEYLKEKPRYIVNENGDVYSLITNKYRKVGINKDGYRYLNIDIYGKKYTFILHQIIWVYFRGPVPEGYEVDHIDNNKLNNSVDNLQLLTPEQNNKKGGLLNRGAGNKGFKAKLDEEKVRELRSLYDSKSMSLGGLAKKFGICRSHAERIGKREKWAWVT